MPGYEEREENMDYCDLEPAKLCDNCCRCIDSGSDYEEFDIDLTHRIEYISDMLEEGDMLFDTMGDEPYEDDLGQSGSIGPIKIDPKLVAEWERKLRES